MSPRHSQRGGPGRFARWWSKLLALVSLEPRRARRIAIAFGLLCLALLAYNSIQTQSNINNINNERTQRRAQVDARIREIACTLVAPYGDEIPYVKEFRARYHCPPYDPAIAKRLVPTKTRTVVQSSPAPRPRPGGAQPSATSPTATAPVTVPPTFSPPGPTVTSTRTRTTTGTTTVPAPKPTPTQTSSGGVLPIPGCTITVLGTRVC